MGGTTWEVIIVEKHDEVGGGRGSGRSQESAEWLPDLNGKQETVLWTLTASHVHDQPDRKPQEN